MSRMSPDELSGAQVGRAGSQLTLDLGEVRNLATVRVSGHELTTLARAVAGGDHCRREGRPQHPRN